MTQVPTWIAIFKSRWILACAILVGLLIGVGTVWTWLHPPIESVARVTCAAYVSGDAATLERFEYDDERRLLHLDRARIAQVFDALVRPRLDGFHEVGGMTSETNQDLSQGMASIHLRNSQGQTLNISATPWATPDGPRVNVLHNLLCNAWRAEYIVKAGLPSTKRTVYESRLKGLDKDALTLTRLGFQGFASDRPEGGIVPWTDYRHRMVLALEAQNH